MLDDDEIDLEDIESRLYSQVYHSNSEAAEPQVNTSHCENLSQPPGNMRPPRRYFQCGVTRNSKVFNRWSNEGIPYEKSKKHGSSTSHPYVSTNHIKHDEGKCDVSASKVKIVMANPRKKVSFPNLKKQKNKAKVQKKIKFKQNKKRPNLVDIVTTVSTTKKLNTHIRFSNAEEDNETSIITLSDSDDCAEIPEVRPVLSLIDSDEDTKFDVTKVKTDESQQDEKNKNESVVNETDDVIFVEPVPIEVINLDEDTEPVNSSDPEKNSAELHKKGSDSETASVASSTNSANNSPVKNKSNASPTKLLPKERKELLSTPESTSNDFIDDNIEMNQSNFNFSLHGADFDNQNFLKPPKPVETCETESSCSTTDMNLLKNSVFNEVEFPKEDLFSETNLEKFGNSITPVRQRVAKQSAQSTPKETVKETRNIYSSSDSSSESDFEEARAKCSQQEVLKKNANLPSLSPMQAGNELRPKLNIKRTKKTINLSSKYDLISTTPTPSNAEKNKKRKSQMPEPSVSKKKSNKNKKKKSEAPPPAQSHKSNENVDNSKVTQKPPVTETAENEQKCDQEAISGNKETPVDDGKESELSVLEKNVPSASDNNNESSENTEVVESEKTDRTDSKTEESTSVDKPKDQNNKDADPIQAAPRVVEICEGENASSKACNDLQGFTILDEVFISDSEQALVISSDSESNLSELVDEDPDIQLVNCDEFIPQQSFQYVASDVGVDVSNSKSNVTLENCTLQQVQNAMSSDPKLWEVSHLDRSYIRQEYKGRRCNKCREFGHMAIKCPNKVGPVKCRLCGHSGHNEPRCPNKICTQCGQRGNYTTNYCKWCFKFKGQQCRLCGLMGHIKDYCPDLWRRYHLTTTEGPIVTQNGPMLKPKNKLWCSNCARSGHLEYTCKFYYSPPEYPASNPCIHSYEDVYNVGKNLDSKKTGQKEQEAAEPPPNTESNLTPANYIPTTNQISGSVLSAQRSLQCLERGPVVNPYSFGNLQNLFAAACAGQYMNNLYAGSSQLAYFNNQPNLVALPAQGNIPQNVFPCPPEQIEPTFISNPLVSNYANPQNFYFEDNLPNFISFESNQPALQAVNLVNQVENPLPNEGDRLVKKHNKYHVFSKQAVSNIQQFLNSELKKLVKMSHNLQPILKTVRRTFRIKSKAEFGPYYKTLNMMLFGVYFLKNGKTHLERLKNFKLVNPKCKLTNVKRQALYESYSFIFGSDKHSDVDYKQLLWRI